MPFSILRYTILLLLFLPPLLLSGCGTTSAPTESTTKTLEHTVNATTDTTSSSSGGKSSNSAAAASFINNNYTQIQQEFAAGRGEYLEALAALMEIPADRQEAFFATGKKHYGALYAPPTANAETLLKRINSVIANTPASGEEKMFAATE